jgi:ABC-type methionine transport system ATPase subunit
MGDPRVTVGISDVSVRSGNARILEEVSFDCFEGEWTVIYGQSGAGKSTLLRAINGLCPLTGGRISVLSTRLPRRSRREARTVWRQTGTVLQEVALFETKTALENVVLALRTIGLDRRTAREEAGGWLERLGLGDKLHAYPSRLSGGQRQRVALARAFVARPRLLLLDEPTSALDRATAQTVLAIVKELVEGGTTVVMSSHRTDEVAEMYHQRVGLQNGRVSAIERLVTTGERTRQEMRAQFTMPESVPSMLQRERHPIRSLIRKYSGRSNTGRESHGDGFLGHPERPAENSATPNPQEGTNILKGTDHS